MIAAAPDAFVRAAIDSWGSSPAAFPEDIRRIYIEALRDPATAHAICEEYIAAATLDYAADRRDRAAGRQIEAPTLVLWAASGPLDSWYQDAGGPLGISRAWALEAAGQPLPGGRFFPEENPERHSHRAASLLEAIAERMPAIDNSQIAARASARRAPDAHQGADE